MLKVRSISAIVLGMAKGKKCPSCGNWTMHEKRAGYWYCSSCNASTFE
ncbi:hypothetical protein [Aliivibrio fischeri]|nr:hypothetical protein [Aliivibrio fischeri]